MPFARIADIEFVVAPVIPLGSECERPICTSIVGAWFDCNIVLVQFYYSFSNLPCPPKLTIKTAKLFPYTALTVTNFWRFRECRSSSPFTPRGGKPWAHRRNKILNSEFGFIVLEVPFHGLGVKGLEIIALLTSFEELGWLFICAPRTQWVYPFKWPKVDFFKDAIVLPQMVELLAHYFGRIEVMKWLGSYLRLYFQKKLVWKSFYETWGGYALMHRSLHRSTTLWGVFCFEKHE